MILLTAIALLNLQTPVAKGVTLSRVFAAKEKYAYDVKSHIGLEVRGRGLETFIPFDYDLTYGFTAEVEQMKTDGIAVIHYQRPTMTEIEATVETTKPEVKSNKVNFNYRLVVSPINEILDRDNIRPAAPAKKPAKMFVRASSHRQGNGGEVQQFINELYRLALFNGPVESSLDFSPKFPFWDVVPGDTWKRTVGYQPQALKGRKGQQPVQRLDYTYTYRGIVTVNGKPYQRVTASLSFANDLTQWAREYIASEPGEPQIARMPMNLQATIEYDLDPKTFNTVAARARSQGGFKVFLTDVPAEPYFESRLNGTTTLSLRSLTR